MTACRSAAAFSAPMWGIQMTPFLKSIAGIVLGLAGPFGFGTTFAPTTGPWQPMEFDDNPLTTDRDQFDYMSRQVAASRTGARRALGPLGQGGAGGNRRPDEALPAPDIPTVTLVGTRESIVEVPAIEARMANWPKGRLITIEGGLHEVLMEGPTAARIALEAILGHFAAHA
jgi:lysophospholipase